LFTFNRKALSESKTLLENSALVSLLLDNKKIEALKLLRDKTGFGLKQAKDLVDALQAKLHKT
jgi:ribosomal protein L7/L12